MSDTTPGGWPDKPGVPQNPERDGVHALHVMRGGELVEVLEKWSGAGQCWVHPEMRISPEAMAATVHSYIAPCHTPSEVAAQIEAARRKEREAAAQKADSLTEGLTVNGRNYEAGYANGALDAARLIRERGDA